MNLQTKDDLIKKNKEKELEITLLCLKVGADPVEAVKMFRENNQEQYDGSHVFNKKDIHSVF